MRESNAKEIIYNMKYRKYIEKEWRNLFENKKLYCSLLIYVDLLFLCEINDIQLINN